MRVTRPSSLRRQIAWLVALASGLALVCVLAAGLLYERTTFRPRTLERLTDKAQFMEVTLPPSLDFRDPDSATLILSTCEGMPEIKAAAVYGLKSDPAGATGFELFAAYPDTNAVHRLALKPASTNFTLRTLELWRDVTRNGKVLGRLYLRQELPPWPKRLPQYGIMLGAVILALAVVALVLLRGAQTHLLSPLSALVGTAEQVTDKNDYGIRAGVARDDELGRLATGFNRMLEVIGERDQELRDAGTRMQQVFAAATEVLIVSTDTKGRVALFNAGAERMLGYTAAEVVGHQTPLLWHLPPEVEARGADLSTITGRPVRGFDVFVDSPRDRNPEARDWTMVRKDGTTLRAHLVITAIHDARGNLTGFLGVATDITERERAEGELQRREERFRSLIENASDLIQVINREGIIRFQSPSSERILGFTPAELTGRSGFDLVHPDDLQQARDALKSALTSPNSTVTIKIRCRHRDGTWRILEIIGRSVPEEAQEGYFILNARDVTDSAKLEEQYRQAQKLEAIGRLSGGVAHDFNNILTVIQGNASMMEALEGFPAEAREPLEEIGKAASRAANLTRQLLAFSRRQTLQLVHLELNSVVADMTRMLQRILGEDITMHIHYASQPTVVHADRGMVEQVLLNLVVNSRDAMPDGGRLVIETSIVDLKDQAQELGAPARPGEFVCLSVSDTGCGIPAEVLPRIFEPFFTTKDVGKGTGLGLATVYGIAQQHDGWVKVYSTAGQGATFRTFFPRVAVPADTPAPAPGLASARGGDETILFVEDEVSLRQLGLRILTRLGYHVLEASDGRSALLQWQAHRGKIRLLLTDMVMPGGMTGIELAQRLMQDAPDLKVVYMSGYSAEIAGKDLPLQEGMNFLSKPFNLVRLASVVRTTLDSSERG